MIRKIELCFLMALIPLLNIRAQENNADGQESFASALDSVEISLLTCSPHEEIYSLYGHTALRVNDKREGGRDMAVNYGMFSFGKPFFVLRFIFGLTDYEMGIEPFEAFCRQYEYYGSSVTQQTFNLTAEEKMAILAALDENYKPDNRVYRYNYFYDNCTTRARDMVLHHINGNVNWDTDSQSLPKGGEVTYRDMVHKCCQHHPWVMYGNDMLLGLQADFPTTREQQEFLPQNLMMNLCHATRDFNGEVKSDTTQLVDAPVVIVPARTQVIEEDFPLRPRDMFLILLVVTIAITLIEAVSKKTLWWYDALLMIACGLAGIVLTMMLFSQHPTVRLNLQLLLFNPLPLFFVWRMIKRTRKKERDWQYVLWITLICLFFIGGFWQHYAEGMYLVASSLLVRNVWRFIKSKNN